MDTAAIWSEYGTSLRRFLAGRVGNPSDADDILQDILIKTHRQIGSLRDPAKLKSWLLQVARNAVIDHYRRTRREVPAELTDLADDRAQDPRNNVRRELSRCVRPFVQQLPERYRDTVTAVDLDGQSQKELAVKLGLSHSAVKSRVQRGRRMLEHLIRACCTLEVDAQGNLVDFEPKDQEKASCC